MRRMIFATGNENKMVEIREILGDLPLEILSMKEAGVYGEVEENGSTFEENALIKARAICKLAGEMVLADDSGLEIDYLNKEPGIYSARYAGDHDDEANKKKLLHNLEGVPFEKRTAHFHCSLVITSPVKDPLIAEGNVEGYIVEEERGKDGFGYDPLFFYPPLDKTFGETTADEKNAVSHRANAIKDLLTKFDEWWEE